MTMLKQCGCGNVIELGQVRCKHCDKERHKHYDTFKRDKKTAAFYNSKEWGQVRKVALARCNFLCEWCLKKNKIVPAHIVDHIEPIKNNWAKRLDPENLQCLCTRCHAAKTELDKRKYGGGREKSCF